MNAKTKKALEGSIKKWAAIVDGGQDHGADDCPLCAEFRHPKQHTDGRWTDFCVGCPVREETGNAGCIGSPYDLWTRATSDEYYEHTGGGVWPEMPRVVIGPKSQDAAIMEYEFLCSLRKP